MTVVFVYGTLLQGLERHELLAKARPLGLALAANVSLYDVGEYPALIPGEDEVVGELYEVDAQTLSVLDEVEAYRPSQPEASLYVRQRIPVRMLKDGQTVKAECYVYNGTVAAAQKIQVEDYRRYRLESAQPERYWMLAFGSNLSTARLAQRVGPWPQQEVAYLPGYELVFNKSGEAPNVYANVRFTGQGQCPGVAYALTAQQLVALDPYEAGYLRLVLPVQRHNAPPLMAQLYIAHPEEMCQEQAPTAEYLGHIQRGYEEHKLAPEALDEALARIQQ